MAFSAAGGALPPCCRVLSGGSSDPEGRAMLTDKIEAIGRAPLAALDSMVRAIWTDHAAGRLADAEAQQLAEAIAARRRALRKPVQAHSPLRVSVVRESAEQA